MIIMKKGGLHVHLTNRVAYSLMAILILAIAGVGVYAYGGTVPATMGHSYNEIQRCSANQILKTDSGGTAWTCVNLPSSSQWTTSTAHAIYFLTSDNKERVGIGKNNPTFNLDVTGNARITGDITANSFLYSSDLSLKENIKPLYGSLGKIEQLQGVSFNWKENGNEGVGLIAQDVEKVFPELVSTDNEGLKSVEYGNLVAPLIEAIKEQQKQIDELKKEIERLNGK